MKSIYSKLILGFLASITISFSIAGYFAIKVFSNSLIKVAQDEMRNSVNYFIETAEASIDYKIDSSELKTTLDFYAKGSSSVFIIYDLEGGMAIFGKESLLSLDDLNKINNLAYDKLNNYITDTSFTYTINRVNNNQLQTSEVIELNDRIYVLFLRKSLSEQETIFKQTAFLALVAIIFTGSVIFLIVADIIVKPISRITKANNEVIKGNYHVKVNYYGKDEIAILNQSFNKMALKLAKTEEMRQHFISDISHEFQTPLTSIQGFAKILKNEHISEEQRLKYTDIILFQSQRLSVLSKNMLQLTLLAGEDIQLEKKSYSLLEQLNRVISTQKEIALEKNIEIESKFPKKDIIIQADENRMEQVWINIINNAVKYTMDDGVVTVKAKRNSKDIEVIIEDTGAGISEEALQHIFERFYREDSSRSIQGNGLGLAIAKRIVELHNGNISVNSLVDVGSIFKIVIPLGKESFISKYNKTSEKEKE